MSNTYTVWGVNGATRLAMNQHHMAGVLGLRGGLGEARTWPPAEAAGRWSRRADGNLTFEPYETSTVTVPVLDVQEALYLQGWKDADRQPLTLDGKWGPSTKAAFDKFANYEMQEEKARIPEPMGGGYYAPDSPARLEYEAKIAAIEAKWANIKRTVTAAVNATRVQLPFGEARARLFNMARPETLPGARPSTPGPRQSRPSTPEPDRDESRIVEKTETDWTTWILAGTGIAVAGVALWAVFFRKRRKG